MALTNQGTFGETESDIKYICYRVNMTLLQGRLDFLRIMSVGEEGTFLNGCFKRYRREKEKRKRAFRAVLSR